MIKSRNFQIIRGLFLRINYQAGIFSHVRLGITQMAYDFLISCISTDLPNIINNTLVAIFVSWFVFGVNNQIFVEFDKIGRTLVISLT